jgi:hypothetical protein
MGPRLRDWSGIVNTSPEIGQLAAAVSAAQAEMPMVKKGSENSFFKSNYADLADIIGTTLPVIAKHGLAIVQLPGGDIENQTLTTRLMHASGEWIESTMPLFIPKADAQSQGSALTYARRYAYSAILGIATEDDDGQAAVAHGPVARPVRAATNAERPEQARPPEHDPGEGNAITTKQINYLHRIFNDMDIRGEEVHEVVGAYIGKTITSLKQLTKDEATVAIDKATAAVKS